MLQMIIKESQAKAMLLQNGINIFATEETPPADKTFPTDNKEKTIDKEKEGKVTASAISSDSSTVNQLINKNKKPSDTIKS